jgi:hypothetical protein
MAKQIHIYIHDEREFRKIQLEIKTHWYNKYGESLSNSAMLLEACRFLRDYLSGRGDRIEDDTTRQNIHKYVRIGLSR